jgi:hypothetical protein
MNLGGTLTSQKSNHAQAGKNSSKNKITQIQSDLNKLDNEDFRVKSILQLSQSLNSQTRKNEIIKTGGASDYLME